MMYHTSLNNKEMKKMKNIINIYIYTFYNKLVLFVNNIIYFSYAKHFFNKASNIQFWRTLLFCSNFDSGNLQLV